LPIVVRGAVAVITTGPVKVAAAPTVNACVLVIPRTVLPVAVSKPPTLTALVVVMGAAAVMGAVEVKAVAA